MNKQHLIGRYMAGFFNHYLAIQRSLSPNTILAYRDALKLLLLFVSQHLRQSIDRLTIEQISAAEVSAFLRSLEDERGVSASTRNARLSAIKTFFKYLSREEPVLIEQCAQINHIPKKKTIRHQMTYLDKGEITSMLNAIDEKTIAGVRDKAILLFMFNTGARAQEIVDVTIQDLRLDAQGQVTLFGKGRKIRSCPLWQETVAAIQDYLSIRRIEETNERSVFLNARGRKITRFGLRYIVRKYHERASSSDTSLAKKSIGPHTIRHATAMQLLQAGNDVNMISQWLGHADINTTHIYIEADMKMKREMLEKCSPPQSRKQRAAWNKVGVLDWLNSLTEPKNYVEYRTAR